MKYRTLFLTLSITISFGSTNLFAEESKSNKQEESKLSFTYSDPSDPFEKFNRSMWNLNYNYLDKYLVRPIASSYKEYAPNPVRQGLYNFTSNLNDPSSVVNNLLQGKFKWAANATGRFILNSTVGILGFIDIANEMGLPKKQDTFSEVLGVYGLSAGPYLMIPGYGPLVVREVTDYVDDLYFPRSYLNFWSLTGIWALEGIYDRGEALGTEALLRNAIDPYSFAKNAYLQNVTYKVYDGDVPEKNNGDDLLKGYLKELN